MRLYKWSQVHYNGLLHTCQITVHSGLLNLLWRPVFELKVWGEAVRNKRERDCERSCSEEEKSCSLMHCSCNRCKNHLESFNKSLLDGFTSGCKPFKGWTTLIYCVFCFTCSLFLFIILWIDQCRVHWVHLIYLIWYMQLDWSW